MERGESEGRRGQSDSHQRKPPRVPDEVPPLPPTKRPHPQAQWLSAGDCFRLTCTLCLKMQYTPSQRSQLNGHPCSHSVMLWPRGSFQEAPSSCRHVQGARQTQKTCSHVIPLGTVPLLYILACLTLRQSLFLVRFSPLCGGEGVGGLTVHGLWGGGRYGPSLGPR